MTPSAKARLLEVHVREFTSPLALARWRRAVRRAGQPEGCTLLRVLQPIAGGHGFGTGPPPPRRVVVIGAWTSLQEARAWAGAAHGGTLHAQDGWHCRGLVHRAQGSHYGAQPLEADPSEDGVEPIGVLTLGRCPPRQLPRFLVHGARIGARTRDAAGLLCSVSAGWPITGNMTFTLWQSERHMLDFAYGPAPHNHRPVARATPAILREQLNARVGPIEIEGRWDTRIASSPAGLSVLHRTLTS